MVATEERKIATRKAASKKEAEGDGRANKQPKRKETEDKIVSETKSASR
jgi:hypothetical protein